MEWFIKKNSTLPVFQVEISKDGRSDFGLNENISGNTILISVYDEVNKKYVVASKECYITTSASTVNPLDITYYVNYQFTSRETKNEGKFLVQFLKQSSQGIVIIPLPEKIYVSVLSSFSLNSYSYPSNNPYIIDRPCCNAPALPATPTPTPSITPSVTPTMSLTPTTTQTNTPTPTITPTFTPTPSITKPLYYAYVFAEPQDNSSGGSLFGLGSYMYYLADGVTPDTNVSWYGWGNSGALPLPTSPNYSYMMNKYSSYSGFTGGTGNFVQPTNLKGAINQFSNTIKDSFGCLINQYTFETIEVNNSDINTSLQYMYTVWIPLAGVGGSLNNMTVNVGYQSQPCDFDILATPDPKISVGNITITSGGAIPAGTYRVLYLSNDGLLPPKLPDKNNYYFKGVYKT
jgi:hypothetical protein